MRAETNRTKLEAFMAALGGRVRGEGCIYLTGGATAVLHGWRAMTIDIDLKPDPEPPGLFADPSLPAQTRRGQEVLPMFSAMR